MLNNSFYRFLHNCSPSLRAQGSEAGRGRRGTWPVLGMEDDSGTSVIPLGCALI